MSDLRFSIGSVVMLSLSLIALAGLPACGLYAEPPALADIGPCGSCGPCDLGGRDCATDTCQFPGRLDDVLNEEMVCEELVFVAATGDNEEQGSPEAPVKTIRRGLELLQERQGTTLVLVGASTWAGEIVVGQPVVIVGGISSDFEAIDERPKMASQADGEHSQGVLIEGVQGRVELVGVELEGRGAINNYGARVVDASDVVIRHSRIIAADGVDGEDGADGADGVDGSNGDAGGDGESWRGGEGGGNSECPDTDGGDGGDGGQSGAGEAQDGADADGGTSGGTGAGADGAAGGDGEDGTPGASGTFVDGFWMRGAPGSNGISGESGFGGGGGAGGDANDAGIGGGGGGGGAGGCGGAGGQGGRGGGSSVGIAIVGSQVSLEGGQIIVGDGGDGGDGGAGGAGGVGGDGGAAASGTDGGEDGFEGGAGGNGGDGGTGGDGRGGPAYGLVCDDAAAVELDAVELDIAKGGKDLVGVVPSSEGLNCGL